MRNIVNIIVGAIVLSVRATRRVVFVGCLVVTAYVLGAAHVVAHDNKAHTLSIVKMACAEDDPCWDCATMGNHICGGVARVDNGGVAQRDNTHPMSRALLSEYVVNIMGGLRQLREACVPTYTGGGVTQCAQPTRDDSALRTCLVHPRIGVTTEDTLSFLRTCIVKQTGGRVR